MSRRTKQPRRVNDRIRTEIAEESLLIGEAEPAPAPAPSAEDLFQAIQVRAYYLWEQAGHPHDEDSRLRFWLAAEQQLRAAFTTGG